jgi:methionyl-tRNA formyltransferase
MKFGLFAFGEIGLEIAKFLNERGEHIHILCLSTTCSKEINENIISVSKPGEIIYSDMIYQPAVLEKIRQSQLDIIILAWWPHIVKKALIDMPKIGCLNFHPSLLPNNKGKHPYFWSIVEELSFGVSLHFINEGIDTGDIVFQSEIEKTWCDTGSSLYEKGRHVIVDLFKEKFADLQAGNFSRHKQDKMTGSFHWGKEIEEASKIDLEKQYKAKNLLNIIRARSGFPAGAAWFVDNGKKYEVRIEIKEMENSENT